MKKKTPTAGGDVACPYCHSHASHVLDKRLRKNGRVYRRRVCQACQERFSRSCRSCWSTASITTIWSIC